MDDRVERWIGRYRAAWESNDADDIQALFVDDAEYRTEPHAEAWIGSEEIVDGWLEAADGPGETVFTWELVTESTDLAVVQGETIYADGPTYSNLWIIRFAPDGRATHFTEWWMDQQRDG